VNNNLLHWCVGGTRGPELRELQRDWHSVERTWRKSPAVTAGIPAMAQALVEEAVSRAGKRPALPILVELYLATERLLCAEDLTEIAADWALIEGDVSIAMQVREMLARRKRWATNFAGLFDIVVRRLISGFTTLFAALPENCFYEWEPESGAFGVPLVELLADPADLIERLITFPYDDDALKFDLFLRYRRQIEINLLIASGFRPDDNIHERAERLVLPKLHKKRDGAELARLYLGGTPFAELLELPVPFSVPERARFEHCHIIGGTGHGKTQLMQSMIYEDLLTAKEERRSIVVIDSQGDLIGKLRRLELFAPSAPDSLAQHLIVVDPADVEYPAALNLFDAHLSRLSDYDLVDQERILNGVVELYETFFGELLGAELTQKQGVIFRYLARLMITIPSATVYTLMQLMEDGKPFKPYMDTLEGSARHFFASEFFDPSFSATKKQILKRLWGVLSTPAFERMFAQPTNKLDMFAALQSGKIILISTAKDLLKREGSQLLGKFFISLLTQAALERSTVGEHERTPTMVYVDEAQEYFGDDIETILNQARKYGVGLTLAHQALDQLSPRLRSVLASNTSMKCVGGVSAKDARALAEDLRTEPPFIESMKRHGDRTEFAVYLKHETPRAIRLSVPLGFLERQPTLDVEDYNELVRQNRSRYCGTIEDAKQSATLPIPPRERPGARAEPKHGQAAEIIAEVAEHALTVEVVATAGPPSPTVRSAEHEERELGKGGPKHRYLQNLVKQLAEAQGLRATIEAPLARGIGQVDVLLERTGLAVAVEVSVTTPADYERGNVRKCLAAGYDHVALVLTKSKRSHGRYREAALEGLSPEDAARVSVLTPEEVPDFIAELAAPHDPTTEIVKGYKVKVSRTTLPLDEARRRRGEIADVLARRMRTNKDDD